MVTAIETLEHIADEELPLVLTTLCKKLDKEGCLIISVPTLNVPLNPKHHRHYSIEELDTQIEGLFKVEKTLYIHRHHWFSAILRRMVHNRLMTAGLFKVEKTLYIHRHHWFSAILRRMVHNRLMTAEFLPWLSFTTWLYKRFLLIASPHDGAHLIALLTRARH